MNTQSHKVEKSKSRKVEKITSRRGVILRTLALLALLALPLVFQSCSSNDHMYRHNRSHCDCPTF